MESPSENLYKVFLKTTDGYKDYREDLLKKIHEFPVLRGITLTDCNRLHEAAKGRSFMLFFVISMILLGLFIVAVTSGAKKDKMPDTGNTNGSGFSLSTLAVPVIIFVIWFIPGLSNLGRIISSVIYFSVMSLFIIDKSDKDKFVDHGKFLLMIVLYSGFWVLYFQMFDSVLWYMQAYVDASALNNAVNSFLGVLGIKSNWFFDVEYITSINALTIIILQLLVSWIVKNKKAMPTMITGIIIATAGMALLAVSTHIWIFMAGIAIFSIGEMTAHPKFISYVGLTAPTDKKAMYMGYIFLYGVFGSSVGSVVGAKLYVHFVDNLNQPRTLWLVFSMIGVVTVISLLLYNKFMVPKKAESSQG
ncbi:MAG: MFS transporter [bacterium]|nr:MFS transporter [bacterium]